MSAARFNERPITGGFTDASIGDGLVRVARIENVDRMRPFLTTLASSSDHWAFVSSTGALTAGRRNASHALFPYRTVDRLHDARGRVGGATIVRTASGELWEPFASAEEHARDVARSIERCLLGSLVTLVERDHDLGLEIRQTWTSSERHGLVRHVEISNFGRESHELALLDGVLDLLPASIDPGMAANLSNLVDAYRMSEVVLGVGLFGLGSVPVDRAEPSEALSATSAWCSAPGPRLLSTAQCDAFRRGEDARHEDRSRGVRSAYLVARELALDPGASASWTFAFECDRAADDVEALLSWQRDHSDPEADVIAGARESRAALADLLALVDGAQRTGSEAEDARHVANTLYNSMRGGVFPRGHEQRRADFVDHLGRVGPRVLERHGERIEGWPEAWNVGELDAQTQDDPDLERHLREFLPLAFSRRHGDPSRPWNSFSIDVRGEDGSLRLAYQGNWRDIFQNWEALGCSFPLYLEPFVVRFLNASTADGYNPYRITSDGIDWEVDDPDDPWSFIGYWGDHQIVYLTRLLERCEERLPGRLAELFGRAIFVHADVPYVIRDYEEMVRDPYSTVAFGVERHEAAEARTVEEGADGRLLHDGDGRLVRATFEEKLLVPFLVKLANLVPGAGIWMNTQRPEWNDANNALVGSGASGVTAAQLTRHAEVLERLLSRASVARLTSRTATLLERVAASLATRDAARCATDAAARRDVVDALQDASEKHRRAVRAGKAMDVTEVPTDDVLALFGAAGAWLRTTLDALRRDDGLFESYTLVSFRPGAIDTRALPLMLEGQVAALSAGIVQGPASVRALEALRASDLYRADLHTYLLYPDRDLPGVLDRGVMPADAVERAPILAELVEAGDTSIVRRGEACLRFAPGIRSRAALEIALDVFAESPFAAALRRDREALLAIHEEVFDHAAFTGRSSTFFGYEGLGCVYWHMVSKLVLAVQETVWRAVDNDEDPTVVAELVKWYRDVRAGLGTHRSPKDYGAFPTEPYSHTPGDGGARQPGMTGQVKEDLLARAGELGLRVRDGQIVADGTLVAPEAMTNPWSFTYCGTQVDVARGGQAEIVAVHSDGSRAESDGATLDAASSAAVFARDGSIERLEITLPG
ncbi:MAG: hypothetical protein AAF726_03000 [Planctomycetota bacterium]